MVGKIMKIWIFITQSNCDISAFSRRMLSNFMNWNNSSIEWESERWMSIIMALSKNQFFNNIRRCIESTELRRIYHFNEDIHLEYELITRFILNNEIVICLIVSINIEEVWRSRIIESSYFWVSCVLNSITVNLE